MTDAAPPLLGGRAGWVDVVQSKHPDHRGITIMMIALTGSGQGGHGWAPQWLGRTEQREFRDRVLPYFGLQFPDRALWAR